MTFGESQMGCLSSPCCHPAPVQSQPALAPRGPSGVSFQVSHSIPCHLLLAQGAPNPVQAKISTKIPPNPVLLHGGTRTGKEKLGVNPHLCPKINERGESPDGGAKPALSTRYLHPAIVATKAAARSPFPSRVLIICKSLQLFTR